MTTARDSRRCALQALYQFDAGNESEELVRESLEHSAGSEKTHEEGFKLAQAAWQMRRQADEAVARLTPDWPTYRQPVVDRSILRLAYYEIVSGHAPPKVAINEAVELAKEFSTEKSPLFLNGVLDKIYRSLRDEKTEPAGECGGGETTDPVDADNTQNAPDATAAGT
jgi:N utilization substance protein B